MNGCLAKPFKEKELLLEIQKVVDDKNNTDLSEASETPKKDAKNLDLSALKELSNGDEKFYTDMLKTFLDTTSKGVKEMEKLLKENNYTMIAEYAHKISAPCKHLGTDFLYEHLKILEDNCRNNESLDKVDDLIKEIKNEFKIISKLIKKELTKN